MLSLLQLLFAFPCNGRCRQENHTGREQGRNPVKGRSLHAKCRNEKDRQQRAQTKAAIAAHAENAHALSLFGSGNRINIASRFRVKDGAANPHQSDRRKNPPIIGHKARGRQRQPRHKHAQHHKPLAGAFIRQPAKQRLNNRGQKRRGKHQPRNRGIIHAIFTDKKRQQRRQGTTVDIHT